MWEVALIWLAHRASLLTITLQATQYSFPEIYLYEGSRSWTKNTLHMEIWFSVHLLCRKPSIYISYQCRSWFDDWDENVLKKREWIEVEKRKDSLVFEFFVMLICLMEIIMNYYWLMNEICIIIRENRMLIKEKRSSKTSSFQSA